MDPSIALLHRIEFRDKLVLEIRRRAIALCPELRSVSPFAFRQKLNKRLFRALLSVLIQAYAARLEEVA